MPHEAISVYLARIETAVASLRDAYAERYEEELVTHSRANLRIRLRFPQGHLLELNEAIVAEGHQLSHLDYRYHFQDPSSTLVFRYDSTPHFPELPNFPHHRHAPSEGEGVERPDIQLVL